MQCNNVGCKEYGEYVKWLYDCPKNHRRLLDIVLRMNVLARKAGIQVHELIAHKHCHQPVSHDTGYLANNRNRKQFKRRKL